MSARVLAFVLLLISAAQASAAVERFYLGTYDTAGSQGIYIGTLDSESGRLGPLQLAATVPGDPTFLAFSPSHRFLFAALRHAVASFQIRPGGKLELIGRQPAGPDDCHVSLDQTGREVFAANYEDGSIAAYPVNAEGEIGPRTAFISFHGSGPIHDRQKGPHAHSVYVDRENRFLYACDLGSDRIWIFRLGAGGKLIPADPPSAIAPPGSGPRHLTFSPDQRLVYVANELGVSTSVYTRNHETGALTLLVTKPNIDPGWPAGTGSAEISLHPSGKWLYVSTRLRNSMTVFKVNGAFADQSPSSADAVMQPREEPIQREEVVPCPVNFPRSFAIDPTGKWLVVAGQLGNQISVMKIDSNTGGLTPTGQYLTAGSPVCVLFAP